MNRFFVVDKDYDSSHSFVDGMIKHHLIPLNKANMIYFGKCNDKNNIVDSVTRDESSVESYFKRHGSQKLFFSVNALVYFLMHFNLDKNEVFIRNELLALLIFSLFKKFSPERYILSFQSSFPHEEASGSLLKRLTAKTILSISLRYTDKVYVVSSLAGERIRKYVPNNKDHIYIIPLCVDFPVRKNSIELSGDIINFAYIGTFSKLRCLDKTVNAFYKLKTEGITSWKLEFFGGDKSDFLSQYPQSKEVVNELVNSDLIKFNGVVSRNVLIHELDRFHVGINLISPTKMYLESSSTKLGEYLSRGLAVLSNSEIPYHQDVHNEGDVGWLCKFNTDSIYTELNNIVRTNFSTIESKSKNSLRVAEDFLTYKNYLKEILQ